MKKLWDHKIGSSAINQKPYKIDEKLVVHHTKGKIFIIDSSNGDIMYEEEFYKGNYSLVPISNRLLLSKARGDHYILDLNSLLINKLPRVSENKWPSNIYVKSGKCVLGLEYHTNPRSFEPKVISLLAFDLELTKLSELEIENPVTTIRPLNELGILLVNQDTSEVFLHRYTDNWESTQLEATGLNLAPRLHVGKTRFYTTEGDNALRRVFDIDTFKVINSREEMPGAILEHEGRAYVSSRGKMLIFDRDLKELQLELDCHDPKRDSNIGGQACIVGPRMVCFGCNNKKLWCFDRFTGKLLETVQFPDFVSATPVLDDDRLYVCSLDGTIVCLDASNYI